jgi:uncharacterized protein
LALNTFVAIVYLRWSPGAAIFFAANLLQLPSAHVLAAGYMAGLAVLVHKRAWRARLEPFAAVGRMALTNYLMQSTVFTILYYNYTTGWYGRVGPAMDLIPTVIFFAMQVWFSNWWMARFRFGPAEWLWRAITYWNFPPMRREPGRGSLSVSASA